MYYSLLSITMISFILVPQALQTSMNFNISELVYWKISITCDEKCTRPTSTNPNLTRKYKRRNNKPNKMGKRKKRLTPCEPIIFTILKNQNPSPNKRRKPFCRPGQGFGVFRCPGSFLFRYTVFRCYNMGFLNFWYLVFRHAGRESFLIHEGMLTQLLKCV